MTEEYLGEMIIVFDDADLREIDEVRDIGPYKKNSKINVVCIGAQPDKETGLKIRISPENGMPFMMLKFMGEGNGPELDEGKDMISYYMPLPMPLKERRAAHENAGNDWADVRADEVKMFNDRVRKLRTMCSALSLKIVPGVPIDEEFFRGAVGQVLTDVELWNGVQRTKIAYFIDPTKPSSLNVVKNTTDPAKKGAGMTRGSER